ncbi:Beta-amyloid-like protein [Gossypium arboreum]|uniref:Beta-amyloid-like protein n=1 Tax=Gossypium arboreum TaxID=29729 RepID=A0A0B0PBY2_GOSAR|nr:Beta-amyloid-like protein [Gossypium arboreum]
MSPQKWPFLNWTQLGLGKDTLVCHARSCFDSFKLTRPCGLPV